MKFSLQDMVFEFAIMVAGTFSTIGMSVPFLAKRGVGVEELFAIFLVAFSFFLSFKIGLMFLEKLLPRISAYFYHYFPAFIVSLMATSAVLVPVLAGFVWGLGISLALVFLVGIVLFFSLQVMKDVQHFSSKVVDTFAAFIVHLFMVYSLSIFFELTTHETSLLMLSSLLFVPVYYAGIRYLTTHVKGMVEPVVSRVLLFGFMPEAVFLASSFAGYGFLAKDYLIVI